MGRIAESLTRCKVIGLDTPVFLHPFESHPAYFLLTKELLDRIEHGHWEGMTSMIMLMETTVHPLRQLGWEDVARKYEILLVNFPHPTFAAIDHAAALLAAQLRAQFQVRPPDALQVAAALVHGAQAFVTNDKRLDSLSSLVRVVLLDDVLESR
jgi:predicted nucleic acid-binding protein